VFSPGDELALNGHVRYVHELFPGWESLGTRQFKPVVPSQLVSSAGLGYLVTQGSSSFSSTLELQNLTDEHVEDFFGAQRPGRTFHAKISVTY
jgi:hypothetical protein